MFSKNIVSLFGILKIALFEDIQNNVFKKKNIKYI